MNFFATIAFGSLFVLFSPKFLQHLGKGMLNKAPHAGVVCLFVALGAIKPELGSSPSFDEKTAEFMYDDSQPLNYEIKNKNNTVLFSVPNSKEPLLYQRSDLGNDDSIDTIAKVSETKDKTCIVLEFPYNVKSRKTISNYIIQSKDDKNQFQTVKLQIGWAKDMNGVKKGAIKLSQGGCDQFIFVNLKKEKREKPRDDYRPGNKTYLDKIPATLRFFFSINKRKLSGNGAKS